MSDRQPASDPAKNTVAPTVHPLIAFADLWKLDGDYIRCRCCNRPQQVSYALHDFPHRAGCADAAAERNPWKTLNSLIMSQISRIEHP